MSGFKKFEIKKSKPNNPESLFNDLRNRSPEIQHLWAHQADILRAYFPDHLNTQDISFELPTGTGKTLIGLLIGEWRRLYYNERILYLCPTRQLAHQINDLASKYGIETYTFVGGQSDYNLHQFNKYQTGEIIAISTYSGLFNTNPRFDNPNIIIFDDAHSADNYISSNWTLQVNRRKHKQIYFDIISLIEDKLPSSFRRIVKNNKFELYFLGKVNKLPISSFWEIKEKLMNIFDEINRDTQPEIYYPWSIIRDHLMGCNMFVSWSTILLRPWIPPTLTHEPFARAKQRIYMSATLGSGGELERIIGLPKIERIPKPSGWDRQGIGRRFFLFPDYSFTFNEYLSKLINSIIQKRRTLILCPNNDSYDNIKNDCITKINNTIQILGAKDIEYSLEPFTSQDKVVLLLTNRYDGLDLPGDNCRQLIIWGLPKGVNLQEQFLLERLNLFSLLKDRIVTRFTQATGRCTRGSADYSLILIVGQSLFDFCMKQEILSLMHPELQAEIQFGIHQSETSNIDNLLKLIELFFDHGKEWKDAENDIQEIRNIININKDSQSNILASIVKDEVYFTYSLWKGDIEYALSYARNVCDKLGIEGFEGYRALWYYFVGSMAWLISQQDDDTSKTIIAKDFFQRAKSCSRVISWFSELPKLIDGINEDLDVSRNVGYVIENIKKTLDDLGTVGDKFRKSINAMSGLINDNNPNFFESGLKQLGELMGFHTEHPDDTAAPDSIWQISDELILLFEAKSNEKPEGGISVETCRQAKGHYDWASHNIENYDKIQKKLSIIVSQKSRINENAIAHADNLFFIHISRIREFFNKISDVLSKIRNTCINNEEEKVGSKIFEALKINNIDPDTIIKEIESYSVLNLKSIKNN